MRLEFSKLLLIIDYIFMICLVLLSLLNTDVTAIAVAWTAQVAISSGFYYWKAKNENRIKIPVDILRSLNEDEKGNIDLTQVITTIIDKD